MMSEAEVQSRIMMEAALYGIVLTRNNVGAGQFVDDETGNKSFVRFGLFNASREQQAKLKSSDLIGIYPYQTITHGTIGIFIAIECKKEGWTYKGTPREVAQKAFIDFVIARGGRAGFAASVDDFLKIINQG